MRAGAARTHRTAGLRFVPALAAVLLACVPPADVRPIAAGDEAPRYAAPLLTGDTLHLGELHGQVVMLNVWATWCPPCREEMPALEQLHREYERDGLRVIAVSIDNRSAVREIEDFIRTNDLSLTILHDADGRVSRAFRTSGVPETFLVGADGVVVKRWIGRFDPVSEDTRGLVEQALRNSIQRM